MSRAAFVAVLLGCLGASAAGNAEPDAERFEQAMSQLGGSIVVPLVKRIDALQDNDIPLADPRLREAVMRKLEGRIGPLGCKRTPKGTLLFDTPKAFRKGFDEIHSLARFGHARASAEVGAVAFTDVFGGMLGLDERRCFEFFQKAAKAGDSDAKYMSAFCLYYGIGCKANRKQALKLLLARRDQVLSSGTSSEKSALKSDRSWFARRVKGL